MSDFESIGKAFIEYFYKTLGENRAAASALYHDNGLMTWNGQKVQGKGKIDEKYKSFTFKSLKHTITSIECHPSMNGGIIIFVYGLVSIDGENPLMFGEVFHVMSQGNNYFITNDIFTFLQF